jgi:hypothetical protein
MSRVTERGKGILVSQAVWQDVVSEVGRAVWRVKVVMGGVRGEWWSK